MWLSGAHVFTCLVATSCAALGQPAEADLNAAHAGPVAAPPPRFLTSLFTPGSSSVGAGDDGWAGVKPSAAADRFPNLLKPLEEDKKVWTYLSEDPWEGLCTLLIFVSAVLASASGQGGGGMFVPILMMVSHMQVEMAVPVSSGIILLGALVNLWYFGTKRHPDFTRKPVIDFDAVVLLMPLQCLGVTLGVLVNHITPTWMLMLLLSGTLVVALWRSLQRGLKQWQKEQSVEGDEPLSPRSKLFSGDVDGGLKILYCKRMQIAGIFITWALMLAMCFHGLQVCTEVFLWFMLALTTGLIITTYLLAMFVANKSPDEATPLRSSRPARDPIVWVEEDKGCWAVMKYPLVGFGAGFLGGLCGLGGGIIMGPVFLEVGMHAEAVQATTSFFVLLSSSIACIQFFIKGMQVWHFFLWYAVIGLLATVLGQHLCEVFIRRTKRYSLVTLSVSLVMTISLTALTCTGIHHAMQPETLPVRPAARLPQGPEMPRPDNFGMNHFSSKLCNHEVRILRHNHKPYMPYIP